MTLKVNNTAVNEVYLNRNVGYTVVGSPTITDGVVSGFSGSDYLRTTAYLLDSSTKLTDLEIQVKCVCPTGMTGRNNAIHYKTAPGGVSSGIGFFSNGRPSWLIGRDSVSNTDKYATYQTALTAGNTYWLKGILKNGTATLQLSTNGKSWDDIATTDVSNCEFYPTGSNGVGIGHDWLTTNNNYMFTDSIDLNHTYIKINGITWFNGKQQASNAVNALQINGNTVWQR